MSGPGTVTFARCGSRRDDGDVRRGREYVLRLTADDGALLAADEVTVIGLARRSGQRGADGERRSGRGGDPARRRRRWPGR